MPLIDRETIKKVLQSVEVTILNVRNERIVLEGTSESQLQHTNIDTDTESVKMVAVTEPVAESSNPVTMESGVWSGLSSNKIVWDSVVVASDLILTTVYAEGPDYVVDYDNGRVRISNSSSSIPGGSSVYIWYIPWDVKERGVDYYFDYDQGQVRRTGSNGIPDGGTVWVDYSHSQATTTDRLIDETIDSVETYVSMRLKSGYDLTSSNFSLKSGVTSLALYHICLSEGQKVLRMAAKDDAEGLSEEWRHLAEEYLTSSKRELSKFMDVSSLPAGGVIRNRYSASGKSRVKLPTINKRRRY
jgi:hypothetical protein